MWLLPSVGMSKRSEPGAGLWVVLRSGRLLTLILCGWCWSSRLLRSPDLAESERHSTRTCTARPHLSPPNHLCPAAGEAARKGSRPCRLRCAGLAWLAG